MFRIDQAVIDFLDYLPGALIEVEFKSLTITYMNRMAFFLFGNTQEDVDAGMPIRTVFYDDAEYQKAVKVAEHFGLDNYTNSTPYNRYRAQDLHDFKMVKSDGSMFIGEVQGSFVLDEDQVPAGARIYIRDLTKHRITETLLQESEEKYRTLVEFSSDLIFQVNSEEIVLSVNQAAARSLGRTVDEVQGMKISELFPEKYAQGYKRNIESVFGSGVSVSYESGMPTKAGTIWINTTLNPVKDSWNKVSAVIGVARDISQKKQAERELIKMSMAVEQSPASIVITDLKGTILYVNPKFLRLTGYNYDEIIGQNPRVLKSEEQPKEFYAELWTTISSGETWTGEFHNKKKNGDLYWEFAQISPIVDKHGEIFEYLAIKEDITERKLAERLLKESDSLRELMLDVITHDLKNPASTIFSMSELMKTEYPENEYVNLIHQSSFNLLEVLKNTTLINQAIFGEHIPKEKLNLNTLFQGLKEEFSYALEEDDMELILELPKDITITANPLIGDVFKNYISNAIKYAPGGKQIVISATRAAQSLHISVSDFGTTIPERDRHRIFERGTQLEHGKKRGRGLGLAIVKRLAAAHDAKVGVVPNHPTGNSFYLKMPI